MEKNPYLCEEDIASSNTYLKNVKENFVYIWKILINIYDNNGKTDNLPAQFLQRIMSGKLVYNVKKTDHEVAEKLKNLVIALDKQENRDKFMKSFFAAGILTLRKGDKDIDSQETWNHYAPINPNEKNGVALNNALNSYKDDPNMKTGIDMNKYFDTIIEKDLAGKYQLKNISAAEGSVLLDAIQANIGYMKNSFRFTRDFRKKHKENEEEENS